LGRVQEEKGQSELRVEKLRNLASYFKRPAPVNSGTCDGTKDETSPLYLSKTTKP
jgi:hypothetical protein